MNTFIETIEIAAPASQVWQTLADIGAIHQWNPGVANSWCTSEGNIGNGSERRCELGGANFLDEKVVEWIPEKSLVMRITKTNLPFKYADIRFNLTQQGNATRVSVSPIYKLKFGLAGQIIDYIFVSNQYKKGMKNLLNGLKNHIEQGSG